MIVSTALMTALLATAPADRCAIASPRDGSAPLILRDLALAWQAEIPAIHFAGSFGPPQGALDPALEAFLEGKTGFAFLTREISEADLATFRHTYGFDPVTIPIAGGAWDRFGYADAVAIIVNDANPVRKLSFRELDAIFSVSHLRGGAASDWGDVGVRAWRGRSIHLAGGGAWAGEESARALTIRRHVLSTRGRRGVWRPAPGTGSEAQVVDRVAADPLAIGFTGFGHLRAGVHAIAVSTGSGPAYPPTSATLAKDQYPLARTIDLLLPPRGDCLDVAVMAFARYLLSDDGQAAIRRSPFRPLGVAYLRKSQASLERLLRSRRVRSHR